MNLYEFAPIAALLEGASALLTGLTELLEPFAGASAAALAVVLATLGVRLALTALTRSQVRAELHRERLAPQLRALQQRWAKRPEELQKRMMALYKDEGTSPFAGMLPALAQSPVLLVVYGVFTHPLIGGEPNALLGQSFAGAELGGSLLNDPSGWLPHVLLLIAIAGVAALHRLVALRRMAASGTEAGGLARALTWIPFAVVLVAAFVPLAAALYLAVGTAFTLVERLVWRRVLRGTPGAEPEAVPAA